MVTFGDVILRGTMRRRFAEAIPALCMAVFFLPLLLACGRPTGAPEEVVEKLPSGGGAILTVGDIDPDTPAHRIRRIKPLADRLAAALADLGYGEGRVVIARDIGEMGRLLQDGTVDLLIDSTFPSVCLRREVASEIVLVGSIRGDFDYSGIFVTSLDEVQSLEDLLGKVVAFEERHSTSGYLLPYSALQDAGLKVVLVERPRAQVADDEVGYYFSGDEENSLVLALDGTIAAAAVSIKDWEELPAAHRNQLRIIARTITVPRQLVSLRPGMGEELRAHLLEALLEIPAEPLEDHPEAWVWDFRELTPASREALAKVAELADRIQAP